MFHYHLVATVVLRRTTIQTLVSVQPVAVGHCAAPRARQQCTYDNHGSFIDPAFCLAFTIENAFSSTSPR